MTAAAEDTPAVPAPQIEIGLRRQVAVIFDGLRRSPIARALAWLAFGILVVILATAYGQIRLNSWNKPFFDALSRRDLNDFIRQLGIFFVIATVLLILNVGQRWLVETLKLRLREALTLDLVGHWMMPRRAFWLANAGPMGVNPDQRMHEDARKLCDLSADLGVGLLQASIMFLTFAGVLWGLSAGFSFRLGEHDYAIPGFMLWAAILYAGIGSLLSWWVGRSLVQRNAERYGYEADLRFSLVRINEHLDGISLAGGEADERRRVEVNLAEVLAATRRLVRGWTNLTWVTAGFGWITTVAPILAATPLYFSGRISFGGLMMAAAAFTQAQSSLRWFVDNFGTIADWRATLVRVAGFRDALVNEDAHHEGEESIAYAAGEPNAFSIEGLEVESPSGHDRLKETAIAIAGGERVLIVSEPGTGKTTLFRALAGLWPWGRGRVMIPRGQTVAYMPSGAPYLPRGTLREVLAYPGEVGSFEAEAFAKALKSLELTRLVPLLDQERRWDRELRLDEQLGVSFARLVLQMPPWIIADDAFSPLDEDALKRVLEVFAHELAGSALINIGRPLHDSSGFFGRTLHLVRAGGKPESTEPPQ